MEQGVKMKNYGEQLKHFGEHRKTKNKSIMGKIISNPLFNKARAMNDVWWSHSDMSLLLTEK